VLSMFCLYFILFLTGAAVVPGTFSQQITILVTFR